MGLHPPSQPPAFVVGEITVRDEVGYNDNFLKPAQKTISDHGDKYLAGGYNKTLRLASSKSPDRVVISSICEPGRQLRAGAKRARQI